MITSIYAIQRLARLHAKQYGKARTLPDDTASRTRAQSLLAGTRYRDGSTNPGPLTLGQARDVLAWADARRIDRC